MEIEDNNWAKMSRTAKPSTKKMILDALDVDEVRTEGRPSSPVLPLVGSLNVPVSVKEEKDCE